MITCQHIRTTLCSFVLGLLAAVPVLANGASTGPTPNARSVSAPTSCESFARRQMKLSDRLLKRSNYSRAMKVLNSTLSNCKKEFVQEKLFETMKEWYRVARQGSTSEFQSYISAVSEQKYITPNQRSLLEQRIQSHLLSLLDQEFSLDNYKQVYQICRRYPLYTNENFRGEYYCGTAAEKLGAVGKARSSYNWLLANWESQSLIDRVTLTKKLESMYLRVGQFDRAYEMAREIAIKEGTPESIISTLISIRGNFLAPFLTSSAHFYKQQPSDEASRHIDRELPRVSFPRYVRAFYFLDSGGSLDRGMFGGGATKPPAQLLETVSGSVSILRGEKVSNLAWLVTPVGSRYLVLEFSVTTTPEENVRLENVQQNVKDEAQWDKLYSLEFEKTSPAVGSAIGTVFGAANIDGANFAAYDEIFDDSSVLSYYCIQNSSEEIEESFNLNRSKLEYDESTWNRTSNTPALYHHSITYDGMSLREVVWPNFVDGSWTGVVRVGLVQS
ncbi:MAG: hypothetical protein BRD55_10495 [Bacteroidetes bacterium SW_9_63_38]|nr:MAG: hypothetical protein BRD55_10495 [Bacteroidetes bacterium SW_9_63_38]